MRVHCHIVHHYFFPFHVKQAALTQSSGRSDSVMSKLRTLNCVPATDLT